MSPARRTFLLRLGHTGLAALTLASGLLPRFARAEEARPAFMATAVADALKALGIGNPRQVGRHLIQSARHRRKRRGGPGRSGKYLA